MMIHLGYRKMIQVMALVPELAPGLVPVWVQQ